MVATGNEADVTAAETLRAIAEDDAVRVMLLYVESLRDPDVLAQAARIAHARDVPILAAKAGRTRAGQLTASSAYRGDGRRRCAGRCLPAPARHPAGERFP